MSTHHDIPARPPAQLPRRRDAALRCPRLDHLGVADPLDALRAPDGPSTYSMTALELVLEGRRLRTSGWAGWEVAHRLARPALEVA